MNVRVTLERCAARPCKDGSNAMLIRSERRETVSHSLNNGISGTGTDCALSALMAKSSELSSTRSM